MACAHGACLLRVILGYGMEQVKKLFFNNQKKLNNKGVTLVELLVSITMLSIVVGAFYSCFVLAAKTNAKAKLAHKATSLAQNLMENIKAEDMDSLMRQIVYPMVTVTDEAGITSHITNFRLVSQTGYDVNANVMHFAGTEPYAISTDGGITASYNTDVDTYQFCLRNIKMENTSFDALITVEAPEETSIGNKELVHIPSMDSNYDAVISNAAVYDREAVSYFESKGVYDALSPSDITRTITVEIDEDVKLNGAVGYQVDATYRYDCQDEMYEVTDMVFSNEEDMARTLRNVFVFFNPHFEWIDTGWTENIVIQNMDDYETDLYLIKQQPTDDEAALMQESSKVYSVKVSVNEDGLDASSVDIKTNLGYAFKNPIIYMGDTRCQAEYYFNGVQKITDFDTFFDITALTNMEEEELLFVVNIKIYQANPERDMTVANPFEWDTLLAEMNGTLRN